jgi:uncharacterized protein YyaL (SSP411 family)
LSALFDYLDPGIQIVIRPGDAAHATAWLMLARELAGAQLAGLGPARRRAAAGLARRDLEVYMIPDRVAAGELPGVLCARKPEPGGVAYVCRGTHCLAPLRTPEELRDALL